MQTELQMKVQVTKDKRIMLAIILGSLSAIGPLSIDMYLPAFPALTNDLHATSALTQLSLTACLLGIALGQLWVGAWSDRQGRKKPIVIGLVIYAVASFLCALTPTVWLLIVLRFIQGAAGSAGIVLSRAIVRDLYTGSELTKFFSALMLVNGAAPIFAPIMGGQILNFASWHWVFIVLGVLSGLMLLSVIFILPETLHEEKRTAGGWGESLSHYKRLLQDRIFMGYALSQGFITAAMFAYISGSPFVVQNIFGASPQLYSLFFAINGFGIIIASQVTGRLAGRIKERTLLVAGLLFALLGGITLLLIILLAPSLIGVLICFFMIVSSVGIVGTTGFTLAMQNQQKSAGSAAALLGLLPFISGAVVAPLVGIQGEHTAVPMGITIVCCHIGAMLSFIILTKRNNH